jgi:hypothetical protein
MTVLLNIQSDNNEFSFVKNRDVIEFGIKAVSTIINRGNAEGMPLRFGSNGFVFGKDGEMIFTNQGSGSEHVMELLGILSKLVLKNVRNFEIYLERIEKELYNTQVFIVTAYLNEEIVTIARRIVHKGNTVKFLVLDTYDERIEMPTDMEVFFMRREL